MATALTVYLQEVNASSTISTANALIENGTTTTSNTNKNSATNAGTTGWIEVWSQGNASAVSGGGSEPAPSARGWCDDGTTFSGMQFITGTWTGTVKLSLVSGSCTADLHLRAYQRSSGGVYTLIAEMTATGQSLTTTATNYTCTASGVAVSNTFASTDKLYLDLIVNITASSSGTTLKLQESSSGTQGYTSAQVVTPGYVTSNAMGSITPNALTTFLTAANSSRLASAELLVTASGATSTSGASTIGTVTGWGELGLGGPTSFGATDIGNPSGSGAFLDATILEGNQLVAGNYSGTLTLSISEAGKAVNGTMVLRFWKYNVGTTTYTAIGSITLTGQSINSTSGIAFNFPATALPAMSFETGSSLYIDAWLDITSNTMDVAGALNVFFGNSSTQGYSGVEFVASGYLVSGGGDILAISDIGGLQTWNVDSLTAADTTLATGSNIPVEALSAADSILVVDADHLSDALTATDSMLAADSTVIVDALSTTDSAFYVGSDLPLEALNVSDANLVNDQASAADALTITDSSLYTDTSTPLEALNISDAILSLLASSITDAQSISDTLAQSDGYATLEALNVSDVTNATDSAALVDASSASDIGNIQAWGIDALSASDVLTGTDSGSFTDSNAASDSFAQTENYQVSDVQSIADNFAQSDVYQASDVQSVVDALLGIDGSLYIELLPISDSLGQAGPVTTGYDFTDALSSTDLFVGSGMLIVLDGNVSSDAFTQAAQYITSDAQIVSDSLAQSGSYLVSEAQSIVDLFASAGILIIFDSAAASDAFTQAAQYMALDTQSITDSVACLSIFPATEANSVSDALLSSDVIAWLDQVPISDSFVPSRALVNLDTLPISDQFGVVVAMIPVELLSIVDSFVAADAVQGWIDSLSVSDLFSMVETISIEQSPATVVAIGRSGNVVAIGRNGKVVALGRSGSMPAQGR